MAKKFIDATGLADLLARIKAAFIRKSETTEVQSVGIDNTPTKNSTNLVESGGVFSSLWKMGVVSQTITWAGDNTAGWTHTMSNLVYGPISNAHIELFARAGAVFNETTGYFELNEILDISYQEMLDIYVNSIGGLPFGINRNSQFNNYTYRTTIRTRFYSGYSTSINHMFVFAPYLETACLEGCNNLAATTNTFQRCYRLRKVIGTLSAQSWNNTVFEYCSSLEYLQIANLKSNLDLHWSSKLSFDSVAFIVNRANNTSAITISLHATVYALCVADTTVYTYNEQTYTGILALASAKNITIASA